ncbi:MAG: lysostaphin resistance A-like protein [Candidatus Scalinduaceae bacterium]
MLDNTRWNLIDIFKVFLFYFFMMLVGIPVLLWIIKQIFGMDLVKVFGQNIVILSLSLIVNILTCLYVFYIIRISYNLPIASLGFTTSNWKRDTKLGLKRYFIVLPVIVLAGFVVDFISRIFGTLPKQQEIINKILEEDSLAVLIFMILFGILAAPIIEEMLFRGFLQSAVKTTYGKLSAIFVSGFLFALVHLNAHVFLQIFILGLLLAYLFEKTGSLIAPITVHIFHNSATIAFLISFKHLLKGYVATN